MHIQRPKGLADFEHVIPVIYARPGRASSYGCRHQTIEVAGTHTYNAADGKEKRVWSASRQV